VTWPWAVPATWRWEPFNSVARVASNLVDPAGYQTLPHIAPNHIESNTGRLLPYATVAADGVISSKHLFRPGQVIYSKIRPYLAKAVVADFEGLCSADMYPIESDVLDARFLKWWMLTPEFTRLASRVQARTVLPKINKHSLGLLPVPVPPLDEQHRIVDLLEDHLSRLDAADQGLALSLAKLNGLRERTIIHALTGVEIPERVVASLPDVGTSDGDLPSLPRGWEWARLGDVADVVGGITKDAKKQSDPSFVEVPYLRVANVQRGHLKLDIVTQIRADPAKAKSLRLEHGDVLLNEGGDRDKLARGWVWEGQIDECIHQNHVFRARLHEPRLNPYFLSWTGNMFGGRWAERNGKQSVNLASISLRMIKQMPVIVPAAGEADRIAASLRSQLDAYDRLESTLKLARDHGTALRRSLLAAAFSGRLTGNASDVSATKEMMNA
jgi:type I restriction enzyme S subunit